jgi:hypothetical protein
MIIDLPDDAAALLAQEAEALGLAPEALASEALQQWIGDDLDWDEDIRRLEEPGESIPLDDAFDRMNAAIAAVHAKSK